MSGRIILKTNPLPTDIKKLGVEGVNKIWRDAKLRSAGLKRAKTLIAAEEHSVGSQEAPDSARIEMKNLLSDYDLYSGRPEELVEKMQKKLTELLYIDELLEIKGIGLITVSGFIQRWVTSVVLITRNSCRNWQDMRL